MKDFETISGLSAPNSLKGCLIALGVSTVTVLIHLVVPIRPIVDAVMIPPIVALAIAIDQPSMLIALPGIFAASCTFLIQLDAVALITYSLIYYNMFDMF